MTVSAIEWNMKRFRVKNNFSSFKDKTVRTLFYQSAYTYLNISTRTIFFHQILWQLQLENRSAGCSDVYVLPHILLYAVYVWSINDFTNCTTLYGEIILKKHVFPFLFWKKKHCCPPPADYTKTPRARATEGRPFVPVPTMSHCVLLEFPIALLVRTRASLSSAAAYSVTLLSNSVLDSSPRTLSNPIFVIRPESNACRACRNTADDWRDVRRYIRVRLWNERHGVRKWNRPFWQRREGRWSRDRWWKVVDEKKEEKSSFHGTTSKGHG